MFHLLSKHPEAQARVREELKEVIGKDRSKMLTLQDIHKLKYLDLVAKEVLRLYPSAPMVSRVTLEDVHYKGR